MVPLTAVLRTTPLTAWHEAHGGRMVDFAGWRMPVQYASIVDEHLATRRAVGLFDVSHMGRLEVRGPEALAWLDSTVTRGVADLAVGQIRYTLLTSPEGPEGWSVLDDALVARLDDAADGSPRVTLVVNAGNRARVIAWLESRLPPRGVRLADRTADTAMIAVQGPRAIQLIAELASPAAAAAIAALKTYRGIVARVAGHTLDVSRTGYTGEDGVELIVAAVDAVAVWEAVHDAGRRAGLLPCGLGARDTLRLEAGMPLYGHELVSTSDPFALGLGFAVTLETAAGVLREFPGAAALRTRRAAGSARVRVGLVFAGPRAAREGAAVVRRGESGPPVGVVTSGSFCPTLGVAAAQALVDRDLAAAGTELAVAVRAAEQPARVMPLPLYRRSPPRS